MWKILPNAVYILCVLPFEIRVIWAYPYFVTQNRIVVSHSSAHGGGGIWGGKARDQIGLTCYQKEGSEGQKLKMEKKREQEERWLCRDWFWLCLGYIRNYSYYKTHYLGEGRSKFVLDNYWGVQLDWNLGFCPEVAKKDVASYQVLKNGAELLNLLIL